jgi:ligand-binding sensor domain-containing protein
LTQYTFPAIILLFWLLLKIVNLVVSFILINVIIFPAYISAQALDFTQLSTKEGLPSTECYNVLQDKQGYVWVFTEYGIVKHNGQRFVSVCTNIPINDQHAYAICKDPYGDLYFSNANGKVYSVHNDSAFSVKEIETCTHNRIEPTDVIYQLFVDSSKNIFFSSYVNSFVLSHKTKRVNKLNNSQPSDTVCFDFTLRKNHTTCIRNHTKLGIQIRANITDGAVHIRNLPIGPFSYFIQENAFKIRNHYYLYYTDTIYKINLRGITLKRALKGIIRVRKGPDNTIWVLTNDGILVVDENLAIRAHYLKDRMISDVFFDNNDGAWVTTINQGVFHCTDIYNFIYCPKEETGVGIDFVATTDSTVLFSLANGQCMKYSNGVVHEIHKFSEKLFCSSIIERPNDYVLGTKHGIFLKNKRNGALTEITYDGGSIYSYRLFFIAENAFQSFGGETGILVVDNIAKKNIRFPLKSTSFFQLNDSLWLIGTVKGLLKYNSKNNSIHEFNKEFSNYTITSINLRNKHELWIGTNGNGLFVCEGKNFSLVRKMQNCNFAAIKKILFFNRDGIILSTNTGVFFNRIMHGKIKKLWENICNFEAYRAELFKNTLWIASYKGLQSINLEKIHSDKSFPIVINSIWSGNKRLAPQQVKLMHTDNNLKFYVDFLNYKWPVKGFYFALEGPTQLHGNILGNVLQIQNLNPGSYKLNIYPLRGSTYNKDLLITRSFIIQHAFWQTWWFQVLAVGIAVFLTGLIVAFFYNTKRKRDKQTSDINKLLAEHRLTALKAQINPHFISNSLSAIQSLIASGQIDNANQYIAKFSLLIRYVLKYSDKSVTRLSDELKIIDLNVELEQLRFSNSFIFIKRIGEGIDPRELFIPPLITQPFIENAIWHGLLPLKGQRTSELVLKIDRKENDIIISIIDNGIGRHSASSGSKISNNPYKESKGTDLIRKRIENLNQLYHEKEAKIEIIDLYDDAKALGTCIKIILPIEMLIHLEDKT